MKKPIQVLWDNQAKADLKLIFDFLQLKSLQGAKNVVNDIVAQSKNIHFAEQYQVDEFLGAPYRRMIIRNYKIIYKEFILKRKSGFFRFLIQGKISIYLKNNL